MTTTSPEEAKVKVYKFGKTVKKVIKTVLSYGIPIAIIFLAGVQVEYSALFGGAAGVVISGVLDYLKHRK